MDWLTELNSTISKSIPIIILVYTVGLSLKMKLLRRSVSTTILLWTMSGVSILWYLELQNIGNVILTIVVIMLVFRAITKKDNDKMFFTREKV